MGIIQDIDAALAFVENVATLRDLVKLGASIEKKMQAFDAARATEPPPAADAETGAKIGKP